MIVGAVLGKFMPLHKGHEFLIETALDQCDKVHVFVCTLSNEPIDGKLRVQWMKNRFEGSALSERLIVHHIREDWIPQEPKDCHNKEVFYGIWAGALQAVAGERIDRLFGSETYIYHVSRYMACVPVLVDLKRKHFPVSGTAVRGNPYRYWEYLNEDVRRHFTKKILIIGSESTGKSTLTEHLTDHYSNQGLEVIPVYEYARWWIDARLSGDMNKLEFDHISFFGYNQMSLVHHAMYDSPSLIISDTDAIVSKVFQQVYFGKVDPNLQRLVESEKWDLALFLQPTVPWIDDGQRNLSDKRLEITRMLKNELDENRIPYVTIESSDWEERFSVAIKNIDCLLDSVSQA